MSKIIKLIVVDLDGTLLNNQSQMSERNEKALKAPSRRRQVVLATENRSSATEFIQRSI
jgi:hydroxymethylpyrimidine pyrophosphatase-like HAD family hydrolase